MKSLYISLLSILIINTAKGQLTKGNWLVGGNISFNSETNKSANSSQSSAYTVEINPTIGYFFTNKFATGVKSGIRLRGVKGTGTSVYSKYNNFNIGPFLRYYCLPIDNRINLLVEGLYQFGLEGDKNANTSKNNFSFSAGPVIYFNSSIGLEFIMSYSSYKFNGIEGRNSNIQIGIGIQAHLIK
ncbi:MAG: hypothetical protein EAZ12_02660 [Sphingobacteriia bacterium]|nr:MAG: hypothetical protein EAZ12_02660 [Sphingobacteriia bacterium]